MQCKGKTTKGEPCQRNACEGQEYCFQHISGIFNKFTYFLADFLGCKRRFLLLVILLTILLSFIGMNINYKYNKILDELELKPDVEVEISPYLYTAQFGEYLPLLITNTGDFTFEDVNVFVSSCTMLEKNYFEHYHLPLLPSHSERTLPFGNKDTISAFKKGNCYPFAGENKSYATFRFSPYLIKQGQNYSGASVGCGICFFNATLFAKYVNKNETFIKKNMRSYLNFPVELLLNISKQYK